VIGRPVWLPAFKFDYCNNLLSSVHTDCIILRSARLCFNENNYYEKPSAIDCILFVE